MMKVHHTAHRPARLLRRHEYLLAKVAWLAAAAISSRSAAKPGRLRMTAGILPTILRSAIEWYALVGLSATKVISRSY
jgi:hypothetical protein